MRYLPKSPSERQEMLAAIGARSIEDLFHIHPRKIPPSRAAALCPGRFPKRRSSSISRRARRKIRAAIRRFLGAGVYQHLRSVVTDAMVQRGEFLTSYTPYQAEICAGHAHAIFEFQTLMCQLTGQEVANASMYDGSTALTEAVLMAERLTGRNNVLVARSVHPEYRQVLATYARNLGLEIEEIGYTASGQLDQRRAEPEATGEAAAVVVQSPNFFGVLEDIPRTRGSRACRRGAAGHDHCGAVSLGIVRPPAEADIVAMEGAGFRHRAQLWRALRRRDRHARKVCPPNARAPRRPNHRRRRAPRLRA